MPVKNVDNLLLKLITGVRLFKHLEREDIVALLRNANKSTFTAGEVVFEEGYEGHSMYVVVQGAFEVYRMVKGKHVSIATINAGDHFGEIALIASRPRTASVRAISDSIALRFTKQAIFAEPGAAVYLFRNMAKLMADHIVHSNEEIILHKTGENAPTPTEPNGSEKASGHSPPEEAPEARLGAIRISRPN